ncbi:MAG: DUF481 domain-containing protein [Spirosomataceae bacterium]
MRIFFLYFILMSLCCCIAFAQSTPVDTLQVAAADTVSNDEEDPEYAVAEAEQDSTEKFHFRFSADGVASAGNVNRMLLQLVTAVDWKPTSHFKLSGSPSFIYGTQNKILAEREFFADIRASFWHQKPIYGLAFVSWDRSNLRHILNRWSQAAGIGFKLIQKKKAYLSVTNLILHESADFAEAKDIDVWRNSTRLLGEFSPGKAGKLTLNAVLFLQPAISMRHNFRWNSTCTVAYKMSSTVSLRTKLEDVYESYTAIGRKPNDFRWTIGLAIEN